MALASLSDWRLGRLNRIAGSLESRLSGQSEGSLTKNIESITNQPSGTVIFGRSSMVLRNNQKLVHFVLQNYGIDLSSDDAFELTYEHKNLASKNSHTGLVELTPIMKFHDQSVELSDFSLFAKISDFSTPEGEIGYKLLSPRLFEPNVPLSCDYELIGDTLFLTRAQGLPLPKLYDQLKEEYGLRFTELEMLGEIIGFTRLRHLAVAQQKWRNRGQSLAGEYETQNISIGERLLERTGLIYSALGQEKELNVETFAYVAGKIDGLQTGPRTIKFDVNDSNCWFRLTDFLGAMHITDKNKEELGRILREATYGNEDYLRRLVDAAYSSTTLLDFGNIGAKKGTKKILYLYPQDDDPSEIAMSPTFAPDLIEVSSSKIFRYSGANILLNDFYHEFFRRSRKSEVGLITRLIQWSSKYDSRRHVQELSRKDILDEFKFKIGDGATDPLSFYTSVLARGITWLNIMENIIPKSKEYGSNFPTVDRKFSEVVEIAQAADFLGWLVDCDEVANIDMNTGLSEIQDKGKKAEIKYFAVVAGDLSERVAASLDQYFEKFGEEGQYVNQLRRNLHQFEETMTANRYHDLFSPALSSYRACNYVTALNRNRKLIENLGNVKIHGTSDWSVIEESVNQYKEILMMFRDGYGDLDPALGELFQKKMILASLYTRAVNLLKHDLDSGLLPQKNRYMLVNAVSFGEYLQKAEGIFGNCIRKAEAQSDSKLYH